MAWTELSGPTLGMRSQQSVGGNEQRALLSWDVAFSALPSPLLSNFCLEIMSNLEKYLQEEVQRTLLYPHTSEVHGRNEIMR